MKYNFRFHVNVVTRAMQVSCRVHCLHWVNYAENVLIIILACIPEGNRSLVVLLIMVVTVCWLITVCIE